MILDSTSWWHGTDTLAQIINFMLDQYIMIWNSPHLTADVIQVSRRKMLNNTKMIRIQTDIQWLLSVSRKVQKLWNQLNHIAEKTGILPQLFGIHDYPEQRIRGAPFLLPLAEGPVSATASPRFRPAAAALGTRASASESVSRKRLRRLRCRDRRMAHCFTHMFAQFYRNCGASITIWKDC